MDKVQQQLQEFRQRKLREEQEKQELQKPSSPEKLISSAVAPNISSNTKNVIENAPKDQSISVNKNWTESMTSFLIQLLVWLFLLLIAVKFEFGIIYCILTGFYIIWVNLGRRRRSDGELSAYSVFNPNMERLPGTLTAEQLEGELLHRPM